jgi:hypothetical protein
MTPGHHEALIGPGVAARDRVQRPETGGLAAATRQETQALMMEAMAAHLEFLRETGQPVPEPGETAGVVVLDPAAA